MSESLAKGLDVNAILVQPCVVYFDLCDDWVVDPNAINPALAAQMRTPVSIPPNQRGMPYRVEPQHHLRR